MDRQNCKKCLVNKDFVDFYKNKSYSNGYSSKCISCTRDYCEQNRKKQAFYSKEWRKTNPGYKKQYDIDNYEYHLMYRGVYRLKNKKKILEYNRLYNTEYRKNNKQYFVNHRLNNQGIYKFYGASYRAKKKQATPPWVDLDEIKKIYINCSKGYHVDHIIPLQHSKVCGLHVPWNLQYLTASENFKKSNSFSMEKI